MVNQGGFYLHPYCLCLYTGLPRWLRGWSVCLQYGRPGFNPWVGKIPWRRKWQPTPGFLLGESHGEAWWATVHGVAKSWTQLSNFTYLLTYYLLIHELWGFPGGASGKEPTCQCRRHKRHGFDSWVRKIPWRRAWQPTPVFLPGESHGHRSLVGYSPLGCKELDMTEAT